MRIIGLDPGLRKTGWGVIEKQGSLLKFVACGLIKSDEKAELATRLTQIFNGVMAILEEYKPDSAGIEITFVNKDAGATLKLGQARGVVLLAPALKNIPIGEYEPNKVKKSVVGAGHAEKGQVQTMVSILLPKSTYKNADEADALAIAICHAHHYNVLRGVIQ